MKYDFFKLQFTEKETNPGKTAVAGSDTDMSWSRLQKISERLKVIFRETGVPEGHPVMIYGHKEAFYAAALLACIHSGVTYIPADVIYPEERLRRIQAQTGSQVIICCRETSLAEHFSISISSTLEVTRHRTPCFEKAVYAPGGERLQYIMFTSGSTGEPKGVQITRNNVLTFLKWALHDFPFNGLDVFMNQVPFTFDVSLCDILLAFSHGATLVLNAADVVKEQDKFMERLARYQCTVWTSTPSFVFLFMRHASFNPDYLKSLRTFFFMGEDLPNRTCKNLRKVFPDCTILNAYGPTEATIVTTLVEITDAILDKYPSLPIGYPMPDSRLFLLKEDETQDSGELVISGPHVSPGYFKNEAQTARKFFNNQGLQAFKTGDLSYFADGMFFYLGRNDDQVKMHGFRIELHEISSTLCRNPLVEEAVTVPLKRGHEVKKIISFVILKNNTNAQECKEKLQEFLKDTLPYYMVPGDIIPVGAFLYNNSHKIDKNRMIEDYLITHGL
ncbi:MAG: D-alanine--poly(phosphoribitol) ligase subunit 1 [Bacteroidetes bacterium ADurb.Bin408]|nr:MAG: D-alanine--poly(phosphoribitol) ligase subunit 1 [Bacteroidetes bacterium ADurb.Bin408]